MLCTRAFSKGRAKSAMTLQELDRRAEKAVKREINLSWFRKTRNSKACDSKEWGVNLTVPIRPGRPLTAMITDPLSTSFCIASPTYVHQCLFELDVYHFIYINRAVNAVREGLWLSHCTWVFTMKSEESLFAWITNVKYVWSCENVGRFRGII